MKSSVNVTLLIAAIDCIQCPTNKSFVNLSDCYHADRFDRPAYEVTDHLGSLTNEGTAAGPLAWVAFMAGAHHEATPLENGTSLVDVVKQRVGLTDSDIDMLVDGPEGEWENYQQACKLGKVDQQLLKEWAAARILLVILDACRRDPAAQAALDKIERRGRGKLYRNWFGPKSVLTRV